MGKCRKRKEVGEEGKMVSSTLKMKEVEEDDEGEDDEDPVGINEEKIAEVMRWLEQEITTTRDPYPTAAAAAALPPPSSSHQNYSHSWSHYYHCSPFVTINGNEESCGPSFSDTSSTVMATFHTSSGSPSTSAAVPGSDGGSIVNSFGSDMLFLMEEEDEWLENVIGGATGGLEEGMDYNNEEDMQL